MKINKHALEISKHISNFVTNYAPSHLTSSDNTIRAYETALSLYISYLEDVLKISAEDFNAKCFEGDVIEGWLKWLSEDNGCSPYTCNSRLSAIRKFVYYLSSRDAKYFYLELDVKKVPARKTMRRKASGLTKEAVQIILAEPDITTKSGISVNSPCRLH